MSQQLTFPTHRLVVETVINSEYIKVTNYVQEIVYEDMVDAIIMQHNRNIRFVAQERILLNNFYRSLLSFHFKNTVNLKAEVPQFHIFSDEIGYYHFCVDHNIEFEEQKWFKTAYIKADFETVIAILNNASISLVNTLYPQYGKAVSSVFIKYEDIFKEPEDTQIKPPLEARYKHNPKDYSDFLAKNDITSLYHFTDAKNIESIRKNGICSINRIKKLSLNVNFASTSESRSIDASKNLADYVHLSYERENPMLFVALAEGRLYDYKILKVAVDVIFWKGTLFSNCNAAKKGAHISNSIDFFLSIPFYQFHNKRYDKYSPYKDLSMSEVLVKDCVPAEYIVF